MRLLYGKYTGVRARRVLVATQFYGHSLDKGISGREKAYESVTHTHIVIF